MENTFPKDLLAIIISQGDIETLLKVLPIYPALRAEEKNDPVKFWNYAFEMYFPEYIGVFNKFMITENEYRWKKLSIWLTFAHRTVIYYMGTKFTEGDEVFVGPLYHTDEHKQDEAHMDSRTIIYKNVPMSLRRWCIDILGEPSGQLFTAAFKDLSNFIWTSKGDTIYTMDQKALRYYLFQDLFEVIREDSVDEFYPKSKITDDEQRRILNRMFVRDDIEKTLPFFFFARAICAGIIEDYKVPEYIKIFSDLPNVPEYDKWRGVYFGNCIQCNNVATNIDVTSAYLFCDDKNCVDKFYFK